MGNSKIKLIQAIYEINPDILDDDVRLAVATVTASNTDKCVCHSWPSEKTLSVWKARLRKKGVQIPDRRLKKEKQ